MQQSSGGSPSLSADLASRIARLESEREAKNVLARYMYLCDQPCSDLEFPQLNDLFTQKAIWRGVGALYTQTFGEHHGRDAIVKFLSGYLAPSDHFAMNAHFLTSEAISSDEEGVNGCWMMIQVSTYADGSTELIGARLRIAFRMEDGRWKMDQFTTERLFCLPWAAGKSFSQVSA